MALSVWAVFCKCLSGLCLQSRVSISRAMKVLAYGTEGCWFEPSGVYSQISLKTLIFLGELRVFCLMAVCGVCG